MTATQPVAAPPIPSGPPPKVSSARGVAWARRRRSLKGFWNSYRRSTMGMVGLVILVLFLLIAIVGPMFVPANHTGVIDPPGRAFQPPGSQFLLGTDNYGRPIMSLLIVGARVSLIVGFSATLVTMLLGAGIGIIGGYYGGKTDAAMNALTNWFLVIPWIPLAIVLAAVLGRSLIIIILVIGITSWAGTARLVRAQALTVKERPYVERARALGASDWHLISRHLLPNLMPVIFANTVLTVALSILAETTLAILGLGASGQISWGQTIEAAFDEGALTAGYWWWLIPPGVMIVIVTLAFTMCGYALDEVLNPRLRQR